MGPVGQGSVNSQSAGSTLPYPPPSLILPNAHLTIERTLFHDALEGLICSFTLLLNPVTIIWESNREKWVLLFLAGPPSSQRTLRRKVMGQAFLRAFLQSFPADEKSCVTFNNSTNPTAF